MRDRGGDEFRVTNVLERLTPYETSEVDVPADADDADDAIEPELIERAATLLSVMPRNQLRETIENLLSPNDHERARRAVDALIESAFAVEDETGHIRRVAALGL